MDYEKKYKEALNRAKHALDCHNQGMVSTDVSLITSMFPELKESENERIRKDLLAFIKAPYVYDFIVHDRVDPWIAWIEKQGEQKQEWSEEDDYNLQCMIAKVTSDIQKGNVGRNNELIDWLKSLKDRVQPKPKEWGEEDENYLQSAENACEYQYGKNTSTILWLKSLKDRMEGKEE